MGERRFKVDLKNLSEEADFLCPKCGNLISPDDDSENTYEIVDSVERSGDGLERVIIRCKECDSIISLEGFESLSREGWVEMEISEVLEGSESDYRSIHTISREGESLGHLTVEYARKEDVKAFKRIRKLRKGDPFKCMITIEALGESALEKDDYSSIVRAVKKKWEGLRERDIYLIQLDDGHKKIIGRASDL